MKSLREALDSMNTFHQDFKASLSRTALPSSSNCHNSLHYSGFQSANSTSTQLFESSDHRHDHKMLVTSQGNLASKLPFFTPNKKENDSYVQDLDTIFRVKREQARKEVQKLQNIDLYRVLDINANASALEINKAYKRLCLKYHPDKAGGDAEKFQIINEAYKILSNEELRNLYDQHGSDYIHCYFAGFY